MLERLYDGDPLQGAVDQFWLYIPLSTRSTAVELLEESSEKEQLKIVQKARFVEMNQERIPDTIFKRERGKIYVLKQFQHRFYCFKDGIKWIIVHGVKKKKNRANNSDLDKAEELRKEYLSRKG